MARVNLKLIDIHANQPHHLKGTFKWNIKIIKYGINYEQVGTFVSVWFLHDLEDKLLKSFMTVKYNTALSNLFFVRCFQDYCNLWSTYQRNAHITHFIHKAIYQINLIILTLSEYYFVSESSLIC